MAFSFSPLALLAHIMQPFNKQVITPLTRCIAWRTDRLIDTTSGLYV